MADTLLAERLDEPAPVVRPRTAVRLALTGTPWLVVLGTLLVLWVRGDVPVADVARFTAYWALAVVVPGTLVHRALRGGRGNLPEDLGFGAATGLLLELVAWAAAAATGQQHLLRWWPLPVLVAFAAVPGLRRHWRVGPRRPLPALWHWAICAVLLLAVAWGYAQWHGLPLPPTSHRYYQDLLYHLGLVQELTRAMPFRLPHVAGEPLRYHYLSDAHIAAGSMISGVPPTTVLLRLWPVPVIATAAVLTAGLARDLSRTAWVAPVAALAALFGVPVVLGSPVGASGGSPLLFASPSQTYVLVPLLLLASICVDLVRGRGPGRAWPLVPALGLACAGAKSSALPPLIAGIALAAVVAWVVRRRVPWAAFVALACLLAAMGIGIRLFAGGGASSLQPQVLGLLRFMTTYREALGAGDGVEPGGFLPPGLAHATSVGWYLALATLGWWLLAQAPRWIGALVLGGREHRRDPAGWLLAGAVLAAFGATWAFYHPSASQIYFWLGAIPFGALLACWWLAAARPPWPVPLLGALAGGVAALTVPPLARAAEPTPEAWLSVLAASSGRYALFVLLAGLLAVAVAALAGSRRPFADPVPPGLRAEGGGPTSGAEPGRRSRPRRWTATALAGVTAALLGAGLADNGLALAEEVARPIRPTSPENEPYELTADEMRAALWLDEQAGDDDVVATNVHCNPVLTTPHCDARAFWVTGLGGHRALLESWGYTDAALAAQGRDGLAYARQGPPDPALLEFNDRIFTAPTAADLDRLGREYGVRWLFADTRAGAVSPKLAGLARVRLVAGPVTVYELDRR